MEQISQWYLPPILVFNTEGASNLLTAEIKNILKIESFIVKGRVTDF